MAKKSRRVLENENHDAREAKKAKKRRVGVTGKGVEPKPFGRPLKKKSK